MALGVGGLMNRKCCCGSGAPDCSSLFGLPQSASDSIQHAYVRPDIFSGPVGSLALDQIHKQGFPATVTYNSTTVITYEPVAAINSYILGRINFRDTTAGSTLRSGGPTGNTSVFSRAELICGFTFEDGQILALLLTSGGVLPDQGIQVTTQSPSAGITATLTHEVIVTVNQEGPMSASHTATATVVQSNGATFMNETFSQDFTVPGVPCRRFSGTSGGNLQPRFGSGLAAGDYTQDMQASLG